MGERNDTICSYLEKPEIFADFINGSLFDGEVAILPKELNVRQRTGNEHRQSRTGKKERYRGSRDVIMHRVKNRCYAIIAVENQDELNPVMPVRCMEYDVEEYKKQIRRLARGHKQKKDLKTSAEYLSGIKETDKLEPVVTIIFYHGTGGWDTCQELHDMLNFNRENEIMRKYTPNYKINVISVEELDEMKFQTGLRELIGMMKCRQDKEKMGAYYRENRERFEHMDDDTYDTISTMVNHSSLLECKEEYRTEKGEVNMWKAFEEMLEDKRQEGRREGHREGHREGRRERDQSWSALIKKLIADGRSADLQEMAEDEKLRDKLFAEYGIVVGRQKRLS